MIEIQTKKTVNFEDLILVNPKIRVLNQNEISKSKKVEVIVEFFNDNYSGIIRTIGSYSFESTWDDDTTIMYINETLGL